MSLSTLLEAAKYLDFLDSNNQQQPQFTMQQPRQNKRSAGRPRGSKKTHSSISMSLPSSKTNGVPIPLASYVDVRAQLTSLPSSVDTNSPLSSFASTALLCSKTSGVSSASSSAASSLSSSDSSSSCGEVLMGDSDFSPPARANTNKINHQLRNVSDHHNYHLTHQSGSNQLARQPITSIDNSSSIARYIATTSSGPQMITMSTDSPAVARSAPNGGSSRAGHVARDSNNGPNGDHFSLNTGTDGLPQQQFYSYHNGQTYTLSANAFGGENHLNGPPNSCPPMIMARVQPMILNSMSPSSQSIMAFQPAISTSPTSPSSSYSRHRELHKTLEKNRRAHLRHCFELLKAELPASECADKKTSHINIIKSAIRYVLALRHEECEIDNELQRLTRRKAELTESLSKLQPKGVKEEVSFMSSEPCNRQQTQPQQPAAEQQLSLLLSQSKLD